MELFRLAARMAGSHADGEEILQDAYLKAHGALLAGKFEARSSPRTWLYRVVANTALDWLRRRAVRARSVEHLSDQPPSNDGARVEALVALRELGRWLDLLPLDQRAAIVLCGVEGLTTAEAARVLGASEGAVEQRLVRARTTLRRRRHDVDR